MVGYNGRRGLTKRRKEIEADGRGEERERGRDRRRRREGREGEADGQREGSTKKESGGKTRVAMTQPPERGRRVAAMITCVSSGRARVAGSRSRRRLISARRHRFIFPQAICSRLLLQAKISVILVTSFADRHYLTFFVSPFNPRYTISRQRVFFSSFLSLTF